MLERMKELNPLIVCFNGKGNIFDKNSPGFEPVWVES